jgi:hypothetical protein
MKLYYYGHPAFAWLHEIRTLKHLCDLRGLFFVIRIIVMNGNESDIGFRTFVIDGVVVSCGHHLL